VQSQPYSKKLQNKVASLESDGKRLFISAPILKYLERKNIDSNCHTTRAPSRSKYTDRFIRTIPDWMNNNSRLDLNEILKMSAKYNHFIHMERKYLYLKCKIINILKSNIYLKDYKNKISLGNNMEIC
jgi:hypothetical protein